MRTMDTNTFVNSFKIKPNKSMSFLLGAGASVSSNIPSGGQMVWEFKRNLYCAAHNVRTNVYGDLSKESVQKEIRHTLMDKKDIQNCGQLRNILSILKSVIL